MSAGCERQVWVLLHLYVDRVLINNIWKTSTRPIASWWYWGPTELDTSKCTSIKCRTRWVLNAFNSSSCSLSICAFLFLSSEAQAFWDSLDKNKVLGQCQLLMVEPGGAGTMSAADGRFCSFITLDPAAVLQTMPIWLVIGPISGMRIGRLASWLDVVVSMVVYPVWLVVDPNPVGLVICPADPISVKSICVCPVCLAHALVGVVRDKGTNNMDITYIIEPIASSRTDAVCTIQHIVPSSHCLYKRSHCVILYWHFTH